ncbi:hypothetical protein GE09DRAFT_302039 [Coniochaeta sp. 2T2.1]|nr:hypothetical protein GE09DRAFT_302039 [Coniochaeta sp. 2T2.1]
MSHSHPCCRLTSKRHSAITRKLENVPARQCSLGELLDKGQGQPSPILHPWFLTDLHPRLIQPQVPPERLSKRPATPDYGYRSLEELRTCDLRLASRQEAPRPGVGSMWRAPVLHLSILSLGIILWHSRACDYAAAEQTGTGVPVSPVSLVVVIRFLSPCCFGYHHTAAGLGSWILPPFLDLTISQDQDALFASCSRRYPQPRCFINKTVCPTRRIRADLLTRVTPVLVLLETQARKGMTRKVRSIPLHHGDLL